MGYTTYGSVLGFFILLLIGAFLLSLLFTSKYKVLRYILWGLSGCLLALSIWIVINHSHMISANEKRFVGQLYLDLEKSVYDSTILAQYQNLVLTVKEDNSFTLSQNTSFFPSNKGHWKYFDDGDIALITASFHEGSQEFQFSANPAQWTFESYSSKSLRNGQKIVFSKSDQ